MTALDAVARGDEWVVEAFGCDPERLADRAALVTLFDRMVDELGLRPVGAGQWHVFPSPGGITGMLLLAESHLTVHTFPEHRSLCLNLFCCTSREPWPFAERLAELVGATRVSVRHFERAYGIMAVVSHH
ncbi:MAG TPA: S-adenosylmethionine decarboxylase [Gemmatimonadaceae bacterium]|nr:S-adenosylmethionine decarboxylase [Gemmatimonadaceae bacterium]